MLQAHTMCLMELIDSHCHLDVSAYDADRQAVLARARANAVAGIVVPGIQASGWKALLALCNDEAGLYPALGLHPVFLEQHQPADLQLLEAELAAQRPVAVGEIGLDFHVDGLDHERQQDLFESQLALASAAGLPVILHVRKAHDQVLATLRRVRVRGGICHAFNGSLQQASQYSDLGFRFGFGGMLTFERSTRLRALARGITTRSHGAGNRCARYDRISAPRGTQQSGVPAILPRCSGSGAGRGPGRCGAGDHGQCP
jgi:TatD DNase family protein